MKRYSFYSGERPNIVESPNGLWVEWADAEKEIARLHRLLDKYQHEVARFNFKLADLYERLM